MLANEKKQQSQQNSNSSVGKLQTQAVGAFDKENTVNKLPKKFAQVTTSAR